MIPTTSTHTQPTATSFQEGGSSNGFKIHNDNIQFNLNGKPVVVENPSPNMTLNDYIRNVARLSGTKLVCSEGGCGACTVTALKPSLINIKKANGSYDENGNGENKISKEVISFNSCLRPLCSVDGMDITTIEGIGNLKSGFHPIQERLADNFGSQCGFCSSGVVMNMHSLLSSNPTPCQKDIEDLFDGNICRCTGYRPILSSMKTFASDYDAERSCDETQKKGGVCCSKHFFPGLLELSIQKYPQFKHPFYSKEQEKSHNLSSPRSLSIFQSNKYWYKCLNLSEIVSILDRHVDRTVKLVVGNTSKGIFKEVNPAVFIDIHKIPQLLHVDIGKDSVEIGSAVTINDLIKLVTSLSLDHPTFSKLADHLKKVANNQVRSVASWAGNLVMVNNYANFPSDVCTCFMTYDAKLTIMDNKTTKTGISIAEFLTMDLRGKIIVSVNIPFPLPTQQINTFKVAIRHENSHAIINAGFNVIIDKNTVVQQRPILVFGGLAERNCSMPNTENFLIGKSLYDRETLQTAMHILHKEANAIISKEPGKTEYRINLVTNYFYKAILSSLPSELISPCLQSVAQPFVRKVSSGVQSFTAKSDTPVYVPVPKINSRLQTSGGLRYAGDLFSASTLWGSLVMSTIASGEIDSVDPSRALSCDGVVAFVCEKDIAGKNILIDELEIFASKTIHYYGQAIGLIVANTKNQAEEAAKLVQATYKNVKKPILTIQEAMEENSLFPPLPLYKPHIYNDVEEGFKNSDKVFEGELESDSQFHFHLEQHVCIAEPTQTGGLLLKSATQQATDVHRLVAQACNLPENEIVVEVAQIGGGFGGKLGNSHFASVVASIAASSIGKPVMVQTTLDQTTQSLGKRPAALLKYKVGVKNNGKIQAISVKAYIDFGCTYGDTAMVTFIFMQSFDNCYYLPNLKIEGFGCKTNLPPNTYMRGPGFVQAIFVMENIIESIANELGIDADIIRETNFYQEDQETPYGYKITHFNIPRMWKPLKESSNYETRKLEVQEYNSKNKFTKKGLSLVPVKFGIGGTTFFYGVLLNVLNDGTVNLVHSGVEIGQGIDTKIAQVCASELGIPLSHVRVYSSTTLIAPHATFTGASVTTCLNSQALIEACDMLKEKLKPIKEKLGEGATFLEVVQKAIAQGVDVQSKGWAPPASGIFGYYKYYSYSVVLTETQVDVLTGEVQILRCDILFDAGLSVNPALDVGQIEGGFVQGLGFYLTEEVKYEKDGKLINNGTWEYKPPASKDIPIDFRVTLLANAENPFNVLGSKATGEPPLAASCSAFFAAKHAIQEVRKDGGHNINFSLSSPATVDKIQTSCLLNPAKFNF